MKRDLLVCFSLLFLSITVSQVWSNDEEKTSQIQKFLIKNQNGSESSLVLSHPGDSSIENYSFTYDLSIAGDVFLVLGEIERCRSILEFLLDAKLSPNNFYYSAYNYQSGDPIEYNEHVGLNSYVVISFLNWYIYEEDERYLNQSKIIADAVSGVITNEGCLKGGPTESFVSAEHNFDAMSMYKILYNITNEQKWKDLENEIYDCLENVMWNTNYDLYNVGKDDNKRVTDVQSMAHFTLGDTYPEKTGRQMSSLMKNTQSAVWVNTTFKEQEIEGCDFVNIQDCPHEKMISVEWHLQYCCVLRSIGGNWEQCRNYIDLLFVDSQIYAGKGYVYSSRKSENNCLGWSTPNTDEPSVSSSCWGVFLFKNINPLSIFTKNKNDSSNDSDNDSDNDNDDDDIVSGGSSNTYLEKKLLFYIFVLLISFVTTSF
ncbi:hypothetical protein M0813_18270 [Anaeramoeba flamelloides]|uniref:Uncharacterized protein n=1 Tax=Anaeramoeba flamelloides TaxID=1746091 RepID=A0ABQ8YSR3_9EUKA|nr:hypothetical protein M0813_18270 [Anaeramoeba flamelloides]